MLLYIILVLHKATLSSYSAFSADPVCSNLRPSQSPCEYYNQRYSLKECSKYFDSNADQKFKHYLLWKVDTDNGKDVRIGKLNRTYYELL